MNIVIPIGGIGQRFKDAGYQYPKPLINVLGKPMIYHVLKNLKLKQSDTVWIIYNDDLKDYNFENIIKFYFPKVNIKFKSLGFQTRGAVETVLTLLNTFSTEELYSPLLVLDCDTFYTDDILSTYRLSDNKNIIYYHIDYSQSPIFSYVETDEFGMVTNIKEKIKISNKANTGAYGFKSGHIFKIYADVVLSKDSELYTSYVYSEMIKDGIKVSTTEVSNFNCVGTPTQLESYCSNKQSNFEKLRICFDIDNTLVTYPSIPGDYTSVSPINKNINYLKLLKNYGHTIILYTARRMKTHNGNVGAVVADIAKVTIETLEKYNIPYDEIYFGKPYANFYIDDLAVNPYVTLEKAIGVFNVHTEPRHFNKIEFLGKEVCKTTSNYGEIFFYKNMPEYIKKYFPKINNIVDNKIYMENIEGVSYSYYYINKLLELSDIDYLLQTITDIHNHAAPAGDIVDFNQNYLPKLKNRYESNLDMYSKLPNSDKLYKVISKALEAYSNNTQCIIHGDLVFTNILQTETGLKFIDIRGKVGNTHTIYGDKYYDYAKIYQSIIGYDFILNDVEIDNYYTNKFISHFESHFSKTDIRMIKVITASLIFSMLPLHTYSQLKFEKYLKLVELLLKNL